MLTELELPGFPLVQSGPICLGCRADVPTGATASNPTDYTADEFATWLDGIPSCDAAADAVFPDPRGLVVEHKPGCRYGELPPVALWQQNVRTAKQAWMKVQQAKKPSS